MVERRKTLIPKAKDIISLILSLILLTFLFVVLATDANAGCDPTPGADQCWEAK